MTRYTITHDRFEVGCMICGRLDGYPTLAAALLSARAHAQRCSPRCIVGVFDKMARVGHPEQWLPDGSVVQRREVTP